MVCLVLVELVSEFVEKPRYGVQGASGQQMKGNGFGAQAGGYGQLTKGNGYSGAAGGLGLNGVKTNGGGEEKHFMMVYRFVGNGAAASPHNQFGTKGKGHGAVAWPFNGNGARANGQGRAGSQPLKGNVRTPYTAVKGPGVGSGAFGGLGEPQLARNQRKGFSGHGYNGYGAHPAAGYKGGHGSAGWGLGSPYGHRGTKGPRQGYVGGSGVQSGQGVKPNGKGYPSGGANKPAKPGYGATRPQPGYGMRNAAALGGYGRKPNGFVGAAGASGEHLTKGAKSGYGVLPNAKAAKVAGASNERSLSTEQLSPARDEHVLLRHRAASAPPESTSGNVAMVNQRYPNLPQGKAYEHMPIVPQAARSQGGDFDLRPTPQPASTGLQGKAPKAATPGPAPVIPQTDPAPEPAVILPEGYVTGSAVPEQKGAEADDVFGVDRVREGDSASGNTEPLKTKAVPELVAAKSAGSLTGTVGDAAVTPEEETLKSQPEAGPDPLGVKGLPSGETGATGNVLGASVSKGQGPKPDCDLSGVPNGQWMKIPRPGYGASAGEYSNGDSKANKPGYIGGGYTVPGHGAGLGYPYAGKPKPPGYGNGYGVNVQPDYASLGHPLPAAEGTSGVTYRMSQFDPQSAGLGPSGKLGGVYGGMGNLPFGGQTLGADKSNAKFGIGGLQFVGQPFSTGTNGGPVAGIGGVPAPGTYGYGRKPYQAQPVGLGPDTKSRNKYGLPLSPYRPEHLALGKQANMVRFSKYNGICLLVSTFSTSLFMKWFYLSDNQGLQSHKSASEGRSSEAYDTAGSPYQPLPREPDSAGKSYVKGEVASPVEGEGMPVDRYDNAGYINGQVQLGVVAFPGAATRSPAPSYPSVQSRSPAESHLVPDVAPGAGVEGLPDPAGLSLDSAPATQTQGGLRCPSSRVSRNSSSCPVSSTFSSISNCIFIRKINPGEVQAMETMM
ncbi:hypothetical protein Q5P01_023315 [Channa striata]|uniref:Uncharacterized protein n=1 Tax=Channa striata TaxID=64152 RepID=A0AA88LQW0_CHASR|nr:hypothetical protein Q5P01_023315 [Channa striata]